MVTSIADSTSAGRLTKWPSIFVLSAVELLAMGVWFSATSVVPALTSLWGLSDSGRAGLTMSVQIGFVVGAFGSAVANLADRVPGPRLMAVSAVLAGLSTLLIPLLASGLAVALPLRFLTGLVLAGVYPVGMKIVSTWTREDRGLGIGLLVGALTLGTASPHLLNAFGGLGDWRLVLYLGGGLAILGGLIAAALVSEGPNRSPSPRFDPGYVKQILREREIVLSNLGYLGHMWELFAMWSWIAIFLTQGLARNGIGPAWASAVAAASIAAGGVGSLLAGTLADRLGRTTVTIASMSISGACSLIIGLLFGGDPALLIAVSLVWGFAVVADSAQFSASISELCRKEYLGTALTLQTSLGFLLTLVTIRLIPTLQNWFGWEWAFAFLALGPAVGIWAMVTLRRSPAAARLAGGMR